MESSDVWLFILSQRQTELSLCKYKEPIKMHLAYLGCLVAWARGAGTSHIPRETSGTNHSPPLPGWCDFINTPTYPFPS